MIKLETTMGDIILELDEEKAPKTTANFIEYVKNGHYDGTIFHRVIDGFMIQGGGMDSQMNEKPTGSPIAPSSTACMSRIRSNAVSGMVSPVSR